jgi:hypothetical protein
MPIADLWRQADIAVLISGAHWGKALCRKEFLFCLVAQLAVSISCVAPSEGTPELSQTQRASSV